MCWQAGLCWQTPAVLASSAATLQRVACAHQPTPRPPQAAITSTVGAYAVILCINQWWHEKTPVECRESTTLRIPSCDSWPVSPEPALPVVAMLAERRKRELALPVVVVKAAAPSGAFLLRVHAF